MIKVDEGSRGRLGNKIFLFHTLMQLSQILEQTPYTVKWKGYEHFVPTCDILPGGYRASGGSGHPRDYEISHRELLDENIATLKERYSKGDWRIHPYSLIGPFFRITKKDPREFLKLKLQYLNEISTPCVGIHIRGGDNRGGDGKKCREVHPPDYYISAIDAILKDVSEPTFFLCTDDPDDDYPSYAQTIKYLQDKKADLCFSPSNSPIRDFSILSECDYLIAGSSTFVLAAGMIGKKKKIIHSKDFIEQFKNGDQKWYSGFGNGMFFHDMNHVKSDYYDLWRLI